MVFQHQLEGPATHPKPSKVPEGRRASAPTYPLRVDARKSRLDKQQFLEMNPMPL